MIALDTNVLVRYFVGDDPDQSARATSLIEEKLTRERAGLVTIVAIIELAWVLERVYGAARSAIMDILRELLNSAQVIVEHADAVEAAMAHTHADLADALIHEIGKARGCTRTVTFDRQFARLPGVELLTG